MGKELCVTAIWHARSSQWVLVVYKRFGEGSLSGLGEGHGISGFDYALIAAMSGWVPMMFITRVRL